jgi:sodium/bile acid cotransporter 7
MNVATYLIFTLCCFYLARPPVRLIRAVNRNVADSRCGKRLPNILRRAITVRQMSRTQTVAICFCGAAKTQSLGIPLIAAMWTHTDPMTMAYIQIPVVLYTMEQVFLAQGFVYLFKWYLRRERGKDEPGIEIQRVDIQPEGNMAPPSGRREDGGCVPPNPSCEK